MSHPTSPSTNELALKVVINGLPIPLYYSLTPETDAANVGDQVDISIGRRRTKGWVIGREPMEDVIATIISNSNAKKESVTSQSFEQLSLLPDQTKKKTSRPPQIKPIHSACHAFSSKQLCLFEWMSEYYGASLAEVIENAIPQIVHTKPSFAARLLPNATEKLKTDEQWLNQLKRAAPVQAKIIENLSTAAESVPLSLLNKISSSSRSSLNALVSKNIVEICESSPKDECFLSESGTVFSDPLPKSLTPQQTKALETITQAIHAKKFSPFLLFGVTGSGKTEVYLKAITEVLNAGGCALVIVPEIALTPQLIGRFESRLDVPLAVLHSEVGAKARWSAWESLLTGKTQVAVGARSAIFAPLERLSLIIVDEEHETSYKQSDGLRYNARDVAVMRAKFAQCPIILGSATPSFESIINVKKSRYKLLEMPNRVTSRPLPEIEIVELNKIKRSDMPSENISPLLNSAMESALTAGGQVVILFNRRGFSSYLQCNSCSEVVSCPNCSIALTYHMKHDKLLCHYCDATLETPTACRYCRDPNTTRIDATENKTKELGKLEHRGGGTERIDDELKVLFPKSRIARMDRDTTNKKGAYKSILTSMHLGQTDILVGTQMIAKGHDLPGVTLVGIIDADIGLHMPDFRASEKTFQLLTQAAGRAGRGEQPGRVIIQTRQANHPVILATKKGRFKAFARYELEQRTNLKYPPSGCLMRLIISSCNLDDAFNMAQAARTAVGEFTQQLANDSIPISILGPAPAPIEKLRGRFRWHILVKTPSRKFISQIAKAMQSWRATKGKPKDFRIAIDVDPVDMM